MTIDPVAIEAAKRILGGNFCHNSPGCAAGPMCYCPEEDSAKVARTLLNAKADIDALAKALRSAVADQPRPFVRPWVHEAEAALARLEARHG